MIEKKEGLYIIPPKPQIKKVTLYFLINNTDSFLTHVQIFNYFYNNIYKN